MYYMIKKSGIKLEDNNICFPKKFHFGILLVK